MKKSTVIILVIAFMAVVCSGLVALVMLTTRTVGAEPVHLYITPATTEEDLLGQLAPAVDNPPMFSMLCHALDYEPSARPGHYIAEPGTKYLDLARKLRNGQQDPIRLTIGKFRLPHDLEAYLDRKLMHDDFRVPLDSFHIVRPDTYEFYWTVTPAQFMQRMEREYRKTGLDKETVILAAIVEEETNNAAEKPLIASVYLNRLKKGIPLQADPTVKYAVGDFSIKRILNKHLQTESPFNTYLHTGLPPAPICLPSKSSVDAVLHAPETGYLYFCASPAMDGTHRFAATLAEHNRNAAAFHAALDRKGLR